MSFPNYEMLKFTMPFEPMTIEHLGLRLYSTLPPVLSELVSNAFDAESPKVEISVPTDEINEGSAVIVRDYGHGMDATELQNEFLPIGRNRRGNDSTQIMSKHGKVRVTGRKGLGKLSSFGVADEMEIRAIKGKKAITLRLKFSAMQDWNKTNGTRPYEPEVVASRTGTTNERNGLEITLRGLHRTNKIDADSVRKGLARRLTMIGSSFEVRINGEPIGPGDRVERNSCPPGYSWGTDALPLCGSISNGLSVTGWIGFLLSSSQTNRGVDIFANGKAVELGSYFHYPSTHAQFARAHLVGEIFADFLDAPDSDLASTARNSVVWESAKGHLLSEWGQSAIKWAFDRWLELRRKEKEESITTTAGFDTWLKSRQESEKRVAKRLVKILVDDDLLDSTQIVPLLEIVKSSVETLAFRDLVETLEREVPNAATLIRLFAEWRVIEAREHLQLMDGRRSAIDQLEKFINKGALEVQEMQPLLTENLWLLNTAWTEANEQQTYSKLLREHCKERKDAAEKDRRIDILGVTEGGRMTVVEIKRPEKTLSRMDLEQIEHYVDWARSNLMGTGPDSPKIVDGLLIVGRLSTSGDIQKKQQRLSGDDIRVQTFRDLYAASRRQYSLVERRLGEVAPEYSRSKRKQGRAKSI
jgi:Histidine kinase-, DNA gyrase B-, and HSP90-like ATPase